MTCFGAYRDEQANYSTCVFPRVAFSRPYEAEYVLLKPKGRDAGVGSRVRSGAAAYYLASRRDIEIVCVTNSPVQADICRRKFAKLGGRGQVIVTDFDSLDLPSESFDAIYALESIGYTKNLTLGWCRCWRMLSREEASYRSPGSLDHCQRKEDYLSVTSSSKTGATILSAPIFSSTDAPTRLQPDPLSGLPFWPGPHVNFIQHVVCGSTG